MNLIQVSYSIKDVEIKKQPEKKMNKASTANVNERRERPRTAGVGMSRTAIEKKPSIKKKITEEKSPEVREDPSIHLNVRIQTPAAIKKKSKRVDPRSRVYPDEKWNRSGICADRDLLLMENDCRINISRRNKGDFKPYNKNPTDFSRNTIDVKKEKSVEKRNRYPSKVFEQIVNNPWPQYPIMHDDPIQLHLHGQDWDDTGVQNLELEERCRPEGLHTQRMTRKAFQDNYRIKDKSRPHVVDIKDEQHYATLKSEN